MKDRAASLHRRVESLRVRIETLSSLRTLVNLPPAHDITRRQWAVLELELAAVEKRLLARLNRGARAYLPQAHDLGAARALNSQLGDIELEMSRAFAFFDTYMDVLTQRHTPELGPLLAGCDALAWDGIHRAHPALAIVEPPLVYCDRGFGASTLREGVALPGRGTNPLPLIQIPYSRLKEKYNLTSVLHEVGHEAMVRLGLVAEWPKLLRAALARAGAPQAVGDLYALWSSEIAPDFWTFCACGLASAGAIREIVGLPPAHAFRVSWTDPHPAPYLRALLAFDWCRQVWGRGVWDEWEREWLELYPLAGVAPATRRLVSKAQTFIPAVGRVLLNTKHRTLNGQTLASLFDLSALAPSELRRVAAGAAGALNLSGLAPAAHLAVFRLLKERGQLNEEALDNVMTRWLLRLASRGSQRN
ncbi:MAG TPA: hypothetical protein VF546_03700 [Pyrinomonadaceae bacterium]|jgi:hypothetical protein